MSFRGGFIMFKKTCRIGAVIMMGLPKRTFYTMFPCFCVQDMDIRFINSRENVLAFIFAGRNFLSG